MSISIDIYPSIQKKYLLNTYYAPETMLGIEETMVKTDTFLALTTLI